MNHLEKLLYKVDQCIDFQSVYALEEDFNKCGLTVQTTSNNKIIIARLENGVPKTDDIITDYIFIGSLNESAREISDRSVDRICNFIRKNAGKPDSVKNMPRVWRDGLRMYESSIAIFNEEINEIAQVIID